MSGLWTFDSFIYLGPKEGLKGSNDHIWVFTDERSAPYPILLNIETFTRAELLQAWLGILWQLDS